MPPVNSGAWFLVRPGSWHLHNLCVDWYQLTDFFHKTYRKTDKESFLSEYEFLGKYNPGPGQYNPHVLFCALISFLSHTLSNSVTGARLKGTQPGEIGLRGLGSGSSPNYSLQLFLALTSRLTQKDVKKLKPTITKPEDWRKKHKSQEKMNKPGGPDMGTYRNNYPVEYSTFGKLLVDTKEKK